MGRMNATPSPTPTETAAPAEKPAEVKSQARFLVPLLIVCALGALFWPKEPGRAAPGGKVEDRDGGRFELEDRYRQVTLVHFWATWCPPCRDEMPKLQKFSQELAGRPEFALVMVAVADDRKKALAFIGADQPGAVATTYFDDDWKVSKSWGSDKLPETHLVVNGQVLFTYIGAQNWDDPAIRAKVEAALAGKAKAS